MNIKEKARAYDEALEKANVAHKDEDKHLKATLERIFPELKESEDEKVRKWLIDTIKSVPDDSIEWDAIYKSDVLAWLEKQGEHKPYGQRKKCFDCQFNYAGECKGSCQMKRDEQNPVDKAEPKFHKGEWIIHQGTENIYQVVAVIDNQYQLKYGDNYTIQYCEDVDRCARLWTIQDAKDGDVLCYETKDEIRIFIYKNGHIHYHCCYCNAHLTTVDSFFVVEKYLLCYIHPATKEQRDLLFVKMQEAGYEWNDDKKELKKIVRLTLEHYMNN